MLQLGPKYPLAQTHLLLTHVPPLRQSGMQVAAKEMKSIRGTKRLALLLVITLLIFYSYSIKPFYF